MTQLELFRSTCAHRPSGKFLFRAGFAGETERRFREGCALSPEVDVAGRFGLFTPVNIALKPPEGRTPPDYARYFADVPPSPGAFINHLGVMEVPGSAHHFTRYISPLRNATTLDEVRDFPFTSPEGWTDAHMTAAAEEAHSTGRVVCGMVGHIFENSWQIRGNEQFLMDMRCAPEIPHYILSRKAEFNMATARAAARVGADYLLTGDDVATQRALIMDPALWRAMIKPLWAEIYASARAIKPDIGIWYHSDGDIRPIIPDLIEIGVTILNPLQPECMDTRALKREYGRDLVFDGCVGTQSTMPFGTPAEVRETVRALKHDLGYDGGLILAPTHVLEPEVPPENILAFFEACAEK